MSNKLLIWKGFQRLPFVLGCGIMVLRFEERRGTRDGRREHAFYIKINKLHARSQVFDSIQLFQLAFSSFLWYYCGLFSFFHAEPVSAHTSSHQGVVLMQGIAVLNHHYAPNEQFFGILIGIFVCLLCGVCRKMGCAHRD